MRVSENIGQKCVAQGEDKTICVRESAGSAIGISFLYLYQFSEQPHFFYNLGRVRLYSQRNIKVEL